MAASEAEASWQAEAETLRKRLEVAELVCVMVGWVPEAPGDRGKALYELWSGWLHISGVGTDPADHPELSDERIAELARKRDETRARTLERIWERGS
jgi:hypothetical protein